MTDNEALLRCGLNDWLIKLKALWKWLIKLIG